MRGGSCGSSIRRKEGSGPDAIGPGRAPAVSKSDRRAAQGCTALTLLLYLPRAGGKPAQYKFLHQARCRPLGGINQQIVEGKTYATI